MNNNYYEQNAQEFINDTFNCDMSELYKFFEDKLINPKTILDLGFGSGRDSLYFKNKGYEVYSIDPTKEFCDNGKELGLKNVYQMTAQEMEFENKFDGIWACASLLHISSEELNGVFKKCAKALKNTGIIYVSFKLGDFEGIRNERFFNDMNREKLLQLLKDTGLIVVKEKKTIDVRPDKTTEWYNILLRKNIKVCAICGEIIENGDKSREHFFPEAIWKWLVDNCKNKNKISGVKSSINNNKYNFVNTHKNCNYKKQDKIINIDKLYISNEHKIALKKLKVKLNEYINKYNELKDEIKKKQDNKCFVCNDELTSDCVIRRIKNGKKDLRTIDNARVICAKCNARSDGKENLYN